MQKGLEVLNDYLKKPEWQAPSERLSGER
jgi:hypothetical protein